MELNDKIVEYLSEDFWKKSLMINGKWGVGKTTAIKNFIRDYKNFETSKLKYTHYCFINGYEINNEFDLKKHVVTNSFNIKTKKLDPMLSGLINKVLNGLIKTPKPLKIFFEGVSKNLKIEAKLGDSNTSIGASIIPYNVLNDFYNNHMEYVYEQTDISKCIIIIDEVDRKQDKNLKIIFSKMIDVLENFNTKIIFVANNEQLISEQTVLTDWSEKIFDFKINFEENSKSFKIPEEFSYLFKKYLNNNIKSFSNYRSFEKYKKLEKVVDKKIKSSADYQNSIIIDFKESLFYNIFIMDNPNNFKSENLACKSTKFKDKNKTDLVHLLYTKEAKEFMKLNYRPAINVIKFDLQNYNGDLGKLNLLGEKYIKSHYACHRKDKDFTIKKPLKFVTDDIIYKYKNILNIDYTGKISYRLTYWINTAISLGTNKTETNKLLKILLEKLKYYWKN